MVLVRPLAIRWVVPEKSTHKISRSYVGSGIDGTLQDSSLRETVLAVVFETPRPTKLGSRRYSLLLEQTDGYKSTQSGGLGWS